MSFTHFSAGKTLRLQARGSIRRRIAPIIFIFPVFHKYRQQIAPRIAGPLFFVCPLIMEQVSALERAARADERAHSNRSKNADDDEDKRVREVRPLVAFLLKTSPGCVRYDFG